MIEKWKHNNLGMLNSQSKILIASHLLNSLFISINGNSVCEISDAMSVNLVALTK